MTTIPAAAVGLETAEARAFIGPRAEYYLRRWARIAPGAPRTVGFNGAAFLLSGVWLLYRRMYRAFWTMIGLVLALGVAEEAALAAGIGPLPLLGALVPLAVAVTCGSFGTYWYYRHARRVLGRVGAGHATDLNAVRRAGGTSWLAASLGCAAMLGLGLFGTMLDPGPTPPRDLREVKVAREAHAFEAIRQVKDEALPNGRGGDTR